MDKELGKIRDEIDRVDRDIISLLEERVRLAKEIGGIKRENRMPVTDAGREERVMENVSRTTLDPGFTRRIYKEIIAYCRNEE